MHLSATSVRVSEAVSRPTCTATTCFAKPSPQASKHGRGRSPRLPQAWRSLGALGAWVLCCRKSQRTFRQADTLISLPLPLLPDTTTAYYCCLHLETTYKKRREETTTPELFHIARVLLLSASLSEAAGAKRQRPTVNNTPNVSPTTAALLHFEKHHRPSQLHIAHESCNNNLTPPIHLSISHTRPP